MMTPESLDRYLAAELERITADYARLGFPRTYVTERIAELAAERRDR